PEPARVGEKTETEIRLIERMPAAEDVIFNASDRALAARRVRCGIAAHTAVWIAQREIERNSLTPSAAELERDRGGRDRNPLQIFDRARVRENAVPLTLVVVAPP